MRVHNRLGNIMIWLCINSLLGYVTKICDHDWLIVHIKILWSDIYGETRLSRIIVLIMMNKVGNLRFRESNLMVSWFFLFDRMLFIRKNLWGILHQTQSAVVLFLKVLIFISLHQNTSHSTEGRSFLLFFSKHLAEDKFDPLTINFTQFFQIIVNFLRIDFFRFLLIAILKIS